MSIVEPLSPPRSRAHDLRPFADRILTAIDAKRAHRPGEPLVVLMGEKHDEVPHILLRQLLAQRLIAASQKPGGPKILFACESPHNIHQVLSDEVRTPSLRQRFEKLMDTHPDLSDIKLALQQSCLRSTYAPRAYENFLSFFIEEGVPLHMVDAAKRTARDGRNYPSFSDPLTDAALKLMPEVGRLARIAEEVAARVENEPAPLARRLKEVFIGTRTGLQGMHLRNIIMTGIVDALIEKQRPDIVTLFCGAAHVVGMQEYGSSLDNLFQKSGYNVLPVIMGKTPNKDMVSMSVWPFFARALVLDSLPSTQQTNKVPGHAQNAALELYSRSSGGEIRMVDTEAVNKHAQALISNKVAEVFAQAVRVRDIGDTIQALLSDIASFLRDKLKRGPTLRQP